MKTADLLESILAFAPSDAAEAADRDFIADFVRTHTAPFSRSHLDAHLTASAVIVSGDGSSVLLGHHLKLGRWLQLGGHGEPGDASAEAVAMREAVEESGIAKFEFHPAAPRPLDLDVHDIPARASVAAHKHLDLRFLIVAPPGALPVHRDDEHLEVRWFTWREAAALPLDTSLRRALAKAMTLVGGKSGE